MSFAAWIFLFGAAAVAGPVLAHLLAKPRYKRVPFTMMRFLQKGRMETQNRSRLRDLLILLLRCTIIVLIAMLFARPQWFTQTVVSDMNRVCYLGLDNSISMAYKDDRQTYFEKMIEAAQAHIRSADINSSFNICALASGQWCRQASREQAIMYVKGLKMCHSGAQVEDFLSDLRNSVDNAADRDVVSGLVISDFTPALLREFIQYEYPISGANIEHKIIASNKKIDNASIVTAVADGFSDGKLHITVSTMNYSPNSQKRTLTAQAIDAQTSSVDIVLNAGSQENHAIDLNVDASDSELLLPIELSLSSDDKLNVDDNYYMVISLPKHRTVNILLTGKNEQEMFLLKTIIETISSTTDNETINLREMVLDRFNRSDLAWADVVIGSSVSEELGSAASSIKTFVGNGGKLILFISPDSDNRAIRQLWQQEVLAALPGKYVYQRASIQPEPSVAKLTVFEDYDQIVKSLRHYGMNNIIVKSFYECTPKSGGTCNWHFDNRYGLIYSLSLGSGTAILVNSSADDSMSSLMKSSVSIAFCRYLLGSGKDITQRSFRCDEQVKLPANATEIQYAETGKSIWIETCSGAKRRAAVVGSFIIPESVDGTGWLKTLTKPIRYAGVNLADGEADMTQPSEQTVANVMKHLFKPPIKPVLTATSTSLHGHYKPLWKIVAWLIIILLVAEAAVANHMKR